MGIFLIYFLALRESNGLDNYLDRPVWERLPGVEPEQAKQMMDIEYSLGLAKKDHSAAFEVYKREFYASRLRELEEEMKQKPRTI